MPTPSRKVLNLGALFSSPEKGSLSWNQKGCPTFSQRDLSVDREFDRMRVVRSAIVSIAAAALFATSSGLHAQDFFDALFGPDTPSPHWAAGAANPASGQSQAERSASRQFSGSRRHSDPARTQTSEHRRVEQKPNSRKGPEMRAKDETSSGAEFCVRTCDGYYFPLIESERMTKQQSCEYACPTAPMGIYEGSTIETARNLAGGKYLSLPTAFSFRDKTTQKCSCNAPEHKQSFSMRVLGADPSLRTGDIVFADHGAYVYERSKLAPAERSTLLSSRTREKIRALLVARRNTVLHDAHPSEIIQASLKLSPVAANDEEDAAAIRPVGDVAAQTVDSAPGVGYSLWTPTLIFVVGASIVISVAMRRNKPAAPAKRLERLGSHRRRRYGLG
jgi:Protein of unknown function (DUF2865)